MLCNESTARRAAGVPLKASKCAMVSPATWTYGSGTFVHDPILDPMCAGSVRMPTSNGGRYVGAVVTNETLCDGDRPERLGRDLPFGQEKLGHF